VLFAVASAAGDKGIRDSMRTVGLVIEIIALIEVIAWQRQQSRLTAQAGAARAAAASIRSAVPAGAGYGYAPYQPRQDGTRRRDLDFPLVPVTRGGPRRGMTPPPARRPGQRPPGRGR
jgi:hypothetical protein